MQSPRIHLAGHRGLVGSAIRRALEARGHQNLLLRTHQELDLTDRQKVRSLYAAEKPQAVILAAAKVGGILANWEQPYEFIQENLAIEQTVIDEAFRAGVKHLLFLGSSCIYPREAPQPLKEEYLLTGPLEETNRPYALAKIAGIELCRSLNCEHGTDYWIVSWRVALSSTRCSGSGRGSRAAATILSLRPESTPRASRGDDLPRPLPVLAIPGGQTRDT